MKTKLTTLTMLGMLAIAPAYIFGKTNPVKGQVIIQNGTESDYQKYKREQEEKIRDNEKEIADLKRKI
jgi:hypothetical protein